ENSQQEGCDGRADADTEETRPHHGSLLFGQVHPKLAGKGWSAWYSGRLVGDLRELRKIRSCDSRLSGLVNAVVFMLCRGPTAEVPQDSRTAAQSRIGWLNGVVCGTEELAW